MENNNRTQNTVGSTGGIPESVQNPGQDIELKFAGNASRFLHQDDTPSGSCAAVAMVGSVYLGQTAMDTPLTFTRKKLLASSTYPGDENLMAGLVDVDPAFGTVTDNGDGTWTFSPVTGFTGDDIPISFTVSDGNGGLASARALVDVTASATRSPVTGNVDLGSMEEDGILTFSAAQLLSGAPDADALAITAVTVNPHYGSVTDNGDGTWTFTPSENFHDFDVPLIFAVENGNGDTDTAVALVDIIAVPDVPEAENGNPERTDEEQAPTFSAKQRLCQTPRAEGDPLVTSLTAGRACEGIVDNGDGTWTLQATRSSEMNASYPNYEGAFSRAKRPDAPRQAKTWARGHPVGPSSIGSALSSATFRKTKCFAHAKYS